MNIKSGKVFASSALMSLVLAAALSVGTVKAAEGTITRIGEIDRYATAAKVATSNWTNSDDVILVTGEGYADAVSASALAKRLNAPILLTSPGSLSTYTENALTALNTKNIYIIGGNASVSASVRTKLKANYNLIELGGADRYETNAKVAQKLVDLGVKADEVIMVGGEGFSDALSVAPIAAAKGQILLLGMNSAEYMKPVIDFVSKNNSKVTVVGTKNVINNSIYSAVNAVKRIDGGTDRFDTNMKVLDAFKDTLKMDKMYIANASGDGYADALVASAVAGKSDAPLILVDTEGSYGTTNAIVYIKDNATSKTDLNVIGGTGVVSKNTGDAINAAAADSKDGNGQATIQSIEAVNLNQFKVHFNTAVYNSSAEDVRNYKIDGIELTPVDVNGNAIDENGAVAKAIDDKTVLITLASPRKQYDGVIISVKKSILNKDKSQTIDAFDQNVTFWDTEVPKLKSINMEGNNLLTLEFSEVANIKDILSLESKIKIDGQNIANYGIDSNPSLTKIKNGIIVNGSTWTNDVQFYFATPIPVGDHSLEISDGETNEILSDAAGFALKKSNLNFKIAANTTNPSIISINEAASGEVHIIFDRAMDRKTAFDSKNYELNGVNLNYMSAVSFDNDNNDCTIKIKGLSNIQPGANTLYISNNVKDAYGNKVGNDTRVSFNAIKDETKPTVVSVKAIDSETIRVRFSKDVNYFYATNKSNYKLDDNQGVNISNHIDAIYSTGGGNENSNTNIYDIKLKKVNPDNSNDDWRLTGSNYKLTIKNIIDTVTKPNTMDDYSDTFTCVDDIAPKVTGVYYKQNSFSGKDQVVIYFTEAMDVNTVINKNNYKFANGEGDTKSLPDDANVIFGGDNKSVIIEFPTRYHVKIADAQGNIANTGITNDVLKLIVSNVKDKSLNVLDGVAYTSAIFVNSTGAKVKANTIKVYYEGDDLKASIQFDRAIDNLNPSDFSLGKVAPTSASADGNKVILTFKDGDLATASEKNVVSQIRFANGKINSNANTTKIDLIKSQGQKAYLAIKTYAKTTDETGASIYTLSDEAASIQNTIYDYEANPKTAPEYFTASKDANGGRVYITFDTILSANSGIKADDFVFIGTNGTEIKPDSVAINKNTVIFNFDNDNNNIQAFTGKVSVKVKNTVLITTERDSDGKYVNYIPSSDDLKERNINIVSS
ncbi:cell wall-binding repeat-containing protein [Clostridium sp. P21]|uniref:Cell wall-binding repeat-containing protein n=1 Tax=Clostridium muellerianum TaxID=2716538 RepID=A0A7Y0EKD3_9CLOT|nr:cell wall-binding repeat-containing protein [Clostridium muellerianum]NMM65074.1 cell wall-binding repeat-containing protein [Clostridium muellerianum]